jgi:hypothetical protein
MSIGSADRHREDGVAPSGLRLSRRRERQCRPRRPWRFGGTISLSSESTRNRHVVPVGCWRRLSSLAAATPRCILIARLTAFVGLVSLIPFFFLRTRSSLRTAVAACVLWVLVCLVITKCLWHLL